MSVRKRTWTTSKGVEKEAWIVDYMDQGRKRRLKSFAKKKDAAAFAATASVEIRAGVHTADSASITIAEAGKKWLETAELGAPEREPLERATVDAYRQHLRLHIGPYIGSVKLSQLSAPMVREFLDKLARGDVPGGADPEPRSTAMVRKVRVSLSPCSPMLRNVGSSRATSFANFARRAVGVARGRPINGPGASLRSAWTSPRAKRSRPLWGRLKAAGGRFC